LIAQSEAKLRASRQQLIQSQRNAQIAREVATRSAAERTQIQADRVVQAEQAIQAAKQQAETMRLRKERIADLESKGLRSKQDLELAQNELVKAETEVVRAEKAREITQRDQRLGNLGETQADIEARRAEAAVEQAEANVTLADRELATAKLNLNRLTYDTAAAISRVDADIQSAKESKAKNGSEIQKVENELANLKLRTGQQRILAPTTGRIARLSQVGAGTILQSGDELALIVPTTSERRVELYVTDNDVPWISVGRPVRLQFAGFPAIQLPGFAGSAIGTFGGRVALIDPVDDGTSRYRVVIEPEIHTLPSGRKDDPWPNAELLRPGAEAYGWVLLDTVPLGFELWRQFNGFPPNLPREQRLSQKKGSQEKSLGPIKIKAK
jgi:multidrug resistance efflux pump